MSDKKDVLEFPLEELEVPQAITMMMQAATKCVDVDGVGTNAVALSTDDDRLQMLAEKLEARVEDAIEDAKAVRDESVPEDAPNDPVYSSLDGHNVTLVEEYVEEALDRVVTKVVVDDSIYALLCNERVGWDEENQQTTCIKQWGHKMEHVDMEGNYR